MKFLNFLKTVLTVGQVAVPAVLNVVSPGVGTLVGTVLNSILQAEAMQGAGNGPVKRDAALSMLQVAAPAAIQLIEKQTGKELVDESLFTEGLSLVLEGLVKILNAFRLLPKAAI